MSLLVRICLILFGIAYLISPIDIIPDPLLPYVGWLDDGAVLWYVYYLLRHGKLPAWHQKNPFSSSRQANRSYEKSTTFSENRGSNNTEKSETTDSKRKNSPASDYEILGIKKGASWKEIQKAYRTESKKYHPDRVSHLGQEFASLANEKFVEIQKAYQRLKKEKGQ